ncbi:nuclear transport factor 2 family protein [Sphaerobacter thermophilus]|uniref:nuclear transport factor 2 family protein n=1 Tax=Sphaerobacter thermophilus TaxID=2057 RepID=UPI0039C45F77
MHALDVAGQYFDAWNRRDPDAIMATFAEGGTYADPAAGTLSGPAIGAYAGSLFTAFPDLHFDLVHVAATDGGRVTAEWLMRGTNTGPFAGAPPTGQTIALPGADFITVDGEKVRSVQGYFDRRTFVEQLGLQAMVMPYKAGPFAFGTATMVKTGKQTKPGAVGVTKITVRSDQEREQIREYSRAIAAEMLEMPGFLGWIGVVIGQEMYTITAWEDTEAPRQLVRGGTHRGAMRHFYEKDFALGGMLSVWSPERIKLDVRCDECGRVFTLRDWDESTRCECGAALNSTQTTW